MLRKIFLSSLIACLSFLSVTAAEAQLNVRSLDVGVAKCKDSFDGTLGVGVVDLTTGQIWYYNGDEHFRMQSLMKVPVAIAILRKVDQGALKLDQSIPLTKVEVSEIRNSSIPDPISPTAISATLSSLIRRSISRSNNGAVDVLLRLLGGPQTINALFADAQISGMRVDRYERQAAEARDRGEGPDLMDSATPRGYCDLLYKLKSGKLLSAKSTDYLLDLMWRSETGKRRIRAGFPQGWTIADKTGTGPYRRGISIATNDAAIITSPDNKTWVLTVFLADSKMEPADCDKTIAKIAHVLYVSTQ